MYVVDASVWVSYFMQTEETHTASRDWVSRQANAGIPIFGPSHVLAEISGAVSRRTKKEELGLISSTVISRLPAFQLVPIDPELADVSASVAAGMRLKGADAVYVALSLLMNFPLVTWDKEQLTRPASIIQTLTPATARETPE